MILPFIYNNEYNENSKRNKREREKNIFSTKL